ncbi:MAG TPA: hypothetical protein VEH27_03275 [Methylomirabilota bacterium]|nr:hypothetical protein [Methylomirabilota bacterium]
MRLLLVFILFATWTISALEPISRSVLPSLTGPGESTALQLSADGSKLLFVSSAPGLVTNATSRSVLNLYLADLATTNILLISQSTNGTGPNEHIMDAKMDETGRFIAYITAASDLSPGDTNNNFDIFLHDSFSNVVTQVNSGHGVDVGFDFNISSDGRFCFYQEPASPGELFGQFIRYDREQKTNLLLNLDASGARLPTTNVMVSAKGEVVMIAVRTPSYGLPHRFYYDPPPRTGPLFLEFTVNVLGRVHIIKPGESNSPVALDKLFSVVSTNAAVGLMTLRDAHLSGDGNSVFARIDTFDRYLVRLDLLTERAELILKDGKFNGSDDARPSMAAASDGTKFLFVSTRGLALWEQGKDIQIIAPTPTLTVLTNLFRDMAFVEQDKAIVFSTAVPAVTGDDTGQSRKLFRRDLATGEQIVLASISVNAEAEAEWPVLSRDGYVVAGDTAGMLSAGDRNDRHDVYLTSTNGSHILTTNRNGFTNITANGLSRIHPGGVNSNASVIVFTSLASDLVHGDTNGSWDVFVHERATGQTRLLSAHATNGQPISAVFPVLSRDATQVAFLASGTNWHPTLGTNYGVFISPIAKAEPRFLGSVRYWGGMPVRIQWTYDDSAVLITYGVSGAGYTSALVRTDGVAIVPPNPSPLPAAALSRGGNYLLIPRPSSQFITMNLQDGSSNQFTLLGAGSTLSITSRGEMFATRTTGGPNLSKVNLAVSPATLTLLEEAIGADSLEFSDNGDLLVHGSEPLNRGVRKLRLRNLASGQTNTLSVPGGATNDLFTAWSISPNGEFVAARGTRTFAGETNRDWRVWIFNTVDGRVIDLGAAAGDELGGYALPVFSGDSKTVVFSSTSSKLTAHDNNATADIFALDLSAGDTDNDGLPDNWEVAYFNDLAQTANADPDADGLSNAAELLAGSNPSSDSSAFRAALVLNIDTGAVQLGWAARPGGRYRILAKDEVDSSWTVLGGVIASSSFGTFIDPGAAFLKHFYRVELLP